MFFQLFCYLLYATSKIASWQRGQSYGIKNEAGVHIHSRLSFTPHFHVQFASTAVFYTPKARLQPASVPDESHRID
jgi:hypothetical protein